MLSQPCILEANIIWLLCDIVVDLEMHHPDMVRLSQLRLILKELKENAVCRLHSLQMGSIPQRGILSDDRTYAMHFGWGWKLSKESRN